VTALDHYVAAQLDDGQSPASVNRHLNVVSLIVRAARKKGLLRSNPVELVDRPKEARRRWRILTPAEVARVRVAFAELECDAADDDERAWIRQCGQVFVVVYSTGIRRGELLGLKWGRVRLADPEGPSLRIDETFVRDAVDTPKSEASERTISLGPVAADALFARRADTDYGDDGERVFCHPDTGGPFDRKAYADTFRAALAKAKITDAVRPFHDGRHSAITNGAAAGVAPAALQANAGHADLSTTQRYIDLAGVRFKAEAEKAEARMFGTA
jgi:site-specific recombinase XerD